MVKNMSNAKLSVLMANYNHAQYITEAIEAVINQSHKPYEFIILDDASTDNSVDIIQKYAQSIPFIKFFINKENQGVLRNANRLLDIAKGDYVFFNAADDKILPGFFEKCMDLLSRYPNAASCCSDPVFIKEIGHTSYTQRLNLSETATYFNPSELVKILKDTGFTIPGSTLVIKRQYLLDLGGFHPQLKWHIDWFASHVIAFRKGICYIPEPLACFRILPDSYSSSARRSKRGDKLYKSVIKEMLDLLLSDSYRDVLPLFKESGFLTIIGIPLFQLCIEKRKYRQFLSRRLIIRAFKDYIISITPAPVMRAYYTIKELLLKKIRSLKLIKYKRECVN